jgi:hypothetical protein
MPDMVIMEWDGDSTINDGVNFSAWIPRGNLDMGDVNGDALERTDNGPAQGAIHIGLRSMPLTVEILGNRYDGVDTLKRKFNTKERSLKKLVAKDRKTGLFYYLMGRPASFNEAMGAVTIILECYDDIWRASSPTSVTWNITASGQAVAVNIAGSAEARPIFTVVPNSPKSGGYGYCLWKGYYNPMITQAIGKEPFLVATLNTSTLIAGGKLQADLDDLRLVDNGKQISRWYDVVGATTNVWANLAWKPGIKLTLSGTIASSGAVATINVQPTAANDTALAKLQTPTIIAIGSGTSREIFTVTGVDVKARQLTGVTREARFSSMAAHADGDEIQWIEHDLYILYGNSAVGAPFDNGQQPMIDLTLSTNTAWKWTLFFDYAKKRTARWNLNLLSGTGTLNEVYTATHDGDADPASALGMAIKAYQSGSTWRDSTACLEARFYHPCGIQSIVSNGAKYRYTAAEWPMAACLEKSAGGAKWTQVWNELTPSVVRTWEVWSHSDTIGAAYKNVRFRFDGVAKGTANNKVFFEALGVTMGLPAANVPQLAFASSEQSNYYLDMELHNSVTGYIMTLELPMKVGEAITIDCDQQLVTHEDGTLAMVDVGLNTARVNWFPLVHGAQNIIFIDAGTTDMDCDFTYQERML